MDTAEEEAEVIKTPEEAVATTNSGDGVIMIDSPPRPVRTSSLSSPPQNSAIHTSLLRPPPSPTLSPASPSSSTSVANYSNDNMPSPTSSALPRLPTLYYLSPNMLSVLQDEFCNTYRLWEEHDAVLRRVEQRQQQQHYNSRLPTSTTMNANNINNHGSNRNDNNDWRKYKPKTKNKRRNGEKRNANGGDNHYTCNNNIAEDDDDNNNSNNSPNGDEDEEEWREAFAHLRTLYSRHHQNQQHSCNNDNNYCNNQDQQQQQQQIVQGNYYYQRNNNNSDNNSGSNDFLESLFAIDDNNNEKDEDDTFLEEEKMEEEEEEEDEDNADNHYGGASEDEKVTIVKRNTVATTAAATDTTAITLTTTLNYVHEGNREEKNVVDKTLNTLHHHRHQKVGSDASGQHLHHQNQQRKTRTNIEHLAKLLFRPGSKLSGRMETSSSSSNSSSPSSIFSGSNKRATATTTTQREYHLVIMEENKCDELGSRPRGYLARHKCGMDEQCVFVHVTFVPLSYVVMMNDQDDNEEDDEGNFIGGEITVEKTIDGIDETIIRRKEDERRPHHPHHPPQSQSSLEVEDERMTIQIEYTDGDKSCRGFWNPNTLCFEGIVQKLGDGNDNNNQVVAASADSRGGAGGGGGINGRMRRNASSNSIIGGLISAGTVGGSHHDIDEEHDNNQPREGAVVAAAAVTTAAASTTSTTTRVTSQQPSSARKQSTFSLSPCTHLHPRGYIPSPPLLHLFTIPNIGINTWEIGTISIVEDVGLHGGCCSNRESAVLRKKKSTVSDEEKINFMDELASEDNRKFALHRARTERLLLDTLVKLVELGALIDFAELARKRNVAKRREKWRLRMRKISPRMPNKLKRRKKKNERLNEEDIDSVYKKKVHFYDYLAAISWGGLLEAASFQAERTCAAFRRRSALLDSLTFQSDEYKYQVMSDLRANGLTLASSHSEWDQCIQMGRTVVLGWSWFERGSWSCFDRSAVVGKHCVYLLFQMHSRLGESHELLEKSFRSADARISIERLESLKQVIRGSKSKDDESDEILCGVCQCDINVAEGDEDDGGKESSIVVSLPCSHSFHWGCIREWLHDHSQCPMCRVDLNE